MHTKLASLGITLVPVLATETQRAEGNGATAALILVAGVAMILATSGLIFVVVRRRPAGQAGSTTRSNADPSVERDGAAAG
jgi:hypothetical protein